MRDLLFSFLFFLPEWGETERRKKGEGRREEGEGGGGIIAEMSLQELMSISHSSALLFFASSLSPRPPKFPSNEPTTPVRVHHSSTVLFTTNYNPLKITNRICEAL